MDETTKTRKILTLVFTNKIDGERFTIEFTSYFFKNILEERVIKNAKTIRSQAVRV